MVHWIVDWSEDREEAMMSRQRKWQIIRMQAGLCCQCGKPADSGEMCRVCRERKMTAARNRYRLLHGIPLDAPVRRARPRWEGMMKEEK